MIVVDCKEVINPRTGDRETWSVERISAYKANYGVEVKEAGAVTPTKSKRKSK